MINSKRKVRTDSKEGKKRRLNNKAINSSSNFRKEKKEVYTYETSIALDSLGKTDLVTIPPPKFAPILDKVPQDIFSSSTLCVFDLETTSLRDDCEIVQISAITFDGNNCFNTYVLPEGSISPQASAVNGFTKRDNNLFLRGSLVTSVSAKEALTSYFQWLLSFPSQVVIFGHNIKNFDLKHLFHAVTYNNTEPPSNVAGYVDTLFLFKSVYPGEKSYSQENLFSRIVGGTYLAHDAMEDVKALSKILTSVTCQAAQYTEFSMKVECLERHYHFLHEKKVNEATFVSLLNENVLSKGMIVKMAESGLRYEHLQITYSQSGDEGVVGLLTEQIHGKPRVTKNRKIHQSVIQYLKSISK